jgi:ParB-like chromosome segregation protein Spo0J
MVPIGQVVVDGERRPVNEAKVAELMESIPSVGLLNPIIVVLTLKDGGEGVRLVAGLHRLVQ